MSGFVFTDTETTGLDETKDRITQLAAIRTDDDLKVRGVFKMHIYLPDEIELSEYAQKITGISRESLQNEPPEKYVLAAFLHFCFPVNVKDPLTFAAYNSGFDMKMLIAGFNRYKQYELFKKCIKPVPYDVLRHARQAFPDLPKVWNEAIQREQSHTLELVAAHLGIKLKAHDALEDIAATLKIARHLRRLNK